MMGNAPLKLASQITDTKVSISVLDGGLCASGPPVFSILDIHGETLSPPALLLPSQEELCLQNCGVNLEMG